MKELADIFGISVAGFAVLDNHLHLLVRLDSETVKNWSDEEVILRWARLFPRGTRCGGRWNRRTIGSNAICSMPPGSSGRERLASLSWLMIEGFAEGIRGHSLFLTSFA